MSEKSETAKWRRERWSATDAATRAWFLRNVGEAAMRARLVGDDSGVVWSVRLGDSDGSGSSARLVRHVDHHGGAVVHGVTR